MLCIGHQIYVPALLYLADAVLSNQPAYVILQQDGMTALMMAALGGHSDVVEVLLQHHADVRLQDEVRRFCFMQETSRYNLLHTCSISQERIRREEVCHTACQENDHGAFGPRAAISVRALSGTALSDTSHAYEDTNEPCNVCVNHG